jgi:hypothetical protein
MADNQNPTDQTTATTEPEANSEDSEKKFWDEFDTRVKKHLGDFFEEKKAELTRPRTSRTGGRSNVPDFIYGLMFGPEKKD